MNEADQRRFFDAQNVWDQTMADRILEFSVAIQTLSWWC